MLCVSRGTYQRQLFAAPWRDRVRDGSGAAGSTTSVTTFMLRGLTPGRLTSTLEKPPLFS